jgi:glycosyl hydrolase family 2
MKRSILFIGLILTPRLLPAQASSPPSTRAEVVPSQDKLKLAFPGINAPADYEKYGHFEELGTAHYHYVITDRPALAAAVGEGIYPNSDVYKDPAYQSLLKAGKLAGNQWRFVDTRTAALNFYKWATAAEDPGVKQFYSAMMLERLGYLREAVKGFYAVAVHFPKAVGYTYFGTPWYMGPASLDRVEELLRRHPELEMAWTGGEIQVTNKFDTLTNNDTFSIDPGRLVFAKGGQRAEAVDLSSAPVVQTIGGPSVQLKKYADHRWQLFVEGKPFVIKAVSYSVTPVGLSPDRGTWNASRDWQLLDTNHNGLHDGFFESYIDKNGNGVRDPDEPLVGDAQLLKEMGANTIRAYHHLYNKELLRRLYREYGFYVLCGDVLGGYSVGSGATWAQGTDYRDPTQQKKMLDGVRQMVEEYKEEPYILMWVLGNENVYGVGNNAGVQPVAFYELVDRAAQLIHQLDPTHPVAIANGDILHLDILKEKAPHLDVFGANVYRGEQGFGRSFFQDIREQLDKPVIVTEYGAPAYAEGYTQEEAEAYQAMYLANNWEDLQAHLAGHGEGNALGGVLFEFTDEWWKANSDLPLKIQKEHADWYASKSALYKNLQPDVHDQVPQFGGPFLDGWSYEEWFGITSQGTGKGSPFARVLRPAYYRMKELWNTK